MDGYDVRTFIATLNLVRQLFPAPLLLRWNSDQLCYVDDVFSS